MSVSIYISVSSVGSVSVSLTLYVYNRYSFFIFIYIKYEYDNMLFKFIPNIKSPFGSMTNFYNSLIYIGLNIYVVCVSARSPSSLILLIILFICDRAIIINNVLCLHVSMNCILCMIIATRSTTITAAIITMSTANTNTTTRTQWII